MQLFLLCCLVLYFAYAFSTTFFFLRKKTRKGPDCSVVNLENLEGGTGGEEDLT